MNRTQKMYYLMVGFFAFVAFAFGFGLNDIRPSLAQTANCSLGAGDDWCSEWNISKWLTPIKLDDKNSVPRSVEGSVGPADWSVKGTVRIDGNITNYTEDWRLTKVDSHWVQGADGIFVTARIIRADGADNFNGESLTSDFTYANATSDYKVIGYLANKWHPLYYSQYRWSLDEKATQMTVWYPKQWKVTGRYR